MHGIPGEVLPDCYFVSDWYTSGMNFVARGIFWSGVYVVLVLGPLFCLVVGPSPAGSGFLWDLSAACGFIGAAIMATMFLLTARFRRATAPFGIDLIYYFHRQIAVVGVVFILLHPILLLVTEPRLVYFVRLHASPYHLDAGIGAFLCLAALMVTSLWRKGLNIEYDHWRVAHVVLSVMTLVLTGLHIQGVGHYVNTAVSRLLWSGIMLSCVLVILYVRIIKPLAMRRRPYRVCAINREPGNAWTLTLRPENHAGFLFSPGQFAWLTLWHSPFAMKEHPFSIASSAEHPGEVRFTIKELGDFTRRLRQVKPGQIAYVDAPYGAFTPDRIRAPGYILVAGGIGIVPIMSMLRTLADRHDRRPLILFYAYNRWDDLTFRDELDELQATLDLQIVFILKNQPENWPGEVGLLREELLNRYLTPQMRSFACLVCGPVAMLAVAEQALFRSGIPMRHIHSELFDLV